VTVFAMSVATELIGSADFAGLYAPVIRRKGISIFIGELSLSPGFQTHQFGMKPMKPSRK
jgi:hypothetical protein